MNPQIQMLKNSYEAFTDSASGDEMYEETFRLFPEAGKYDIVVGAWSADTFHAELHILNQFIGWNGEVLDDEQVEVRSFIFFDLTGT